VSPTQTLATRPKTPNLETSPNSPGNSTQIPRGPSSPFPLSQACGPPQPAAAAGPAFSPFLGPAAAHTRTPNSSAAQRPRASASPAPRSASARARTVRMTERAHPSAPFDHRNVARLLTAWPHTAGSSPSSACASAHATEPRCPWTQAAPRACSPARPLARAPSLTLRPHGANLPSPTRYAATTGRTFRP
jgi:hypothetical protein